MHDDKSAKEYNIEGGSVLHLVSIASHKASEQGLGRKAWCACSQNLILSCL